MYDMYVLYLNLILMLLWFRLENWIHVSRLPAGSDASALPEKTILPDFPLLPASKGFCISVKRALEIYKSKLSVLWMLEVSSLWVLNEYTLLKIYICMYLYLVISCQKFKLFPIPTIFQKIQVTSLLQEPWISLPSDEYKIEKITFVN